ncbi:MAG: hypothetical protein FWC26_14730 [Fibromonadales bacterium]|nr:hypothetical protein [Fibromonadales bacterium]
MHLYRYIAPFLFPALLCAQGAVWDGTNDTAWYASNPLATEFTISTAEELAGLAVLVNNGNSFQGKTVMLGANIVLNDTAGWRKWDENTTGLEQWIQIGSSGKAFRGNFDGKGFIISGLYINSTGDNQGLFGVAFGGKISNVGLVGFYVGGKDNVGSIVGSSRCTALDNDSTQYCSDGVIKNYGFLTDTRDNNKKYKTVVIGNQTWMAENLDYYYTIPNMGSWGTCISNCKYGLLYDWEFVMQINSNSCYPNCNKSIGTNHQGICPSGWHIPTKEEWNALINFVGPMSGTKLKATSGWNNDGNGTDDYGFSALPGGYKYKNGSAMYYGLAGFWWSTDSIAELQMFYNNNNASVMSASKDQVRSVRCLKNISDTPSDIPNSTITNTYAIGNVSGINNVGGIIGNGGAMEYSYFVGNVTGTGSNVDGIYGSNTNVSNSYFNPPIDNDYTNWDFTNVWAKFSDANGGYPIFRASPYLQNTAMSLVQPSYTYTGDSIKPQVKIIHANNQLEENTHYTLSYSNNLNAGTATVTATGKGVYTGSKSIDFTIKPATGTAQLPTVNVLNATYGQFVANITLPPNCRWMYPIFEINRAGSQSFEAKCFNPNYIDSATGPIYVNVAKAAGSGTATIHNWIYGQPSTPSIDNPNGAVLVYKYKGIDGTDYQSETIPSNAGKYTMTVTFLTTQNYEEHTTEPDSFTINKAQGTCSVQTDNYKPSNPSTPKCEADNNDLNSVTVSYSSANYPENITPPSNVGQYQIKAIFNETDNFLECRDSSIFYIYLNDIFPPKAKNPTYTSTSQTGFPDMAIGQYYTLSGDTEAINAGLYNAIATLLGGYTWYDNTTDAIPISWEIKKAASEFIALGTLSGTYANGIALKDISLPSDKYQWKEPNSLLNAGEKSFMAYYTESKSNHLPDSSYVQVNIKKAAGTERFIDIDTITVSYNSNLYLFHVKIPDSSSYKWDDNTTPIDTVGINSYKAVYTDPSGNYEPDTGNVYVKVEKGKGTGTVSIKGWTYDQQASEPSHTSFTNPGTPTIKYEDTDGGEYSEQPKNAGNYKIIATFPPSDLYNSFDTTATFTINKAQGSGMVKISDWHFGEQQPTPTLTVTTNDTTEKGITFNYRSKDGYTQFPNPGEYIIEATFPENANYEAHKATAEFKILKANVQVTWTPACGYEFTYNEEPQSPMPSAAGYNLALQTNPGIDASPSYIAAAAEPAGVILTNNNCSYSIKPKPITVTWKKESKYVYNKYTQGPTATIEEPGIDFNVYLYSGAGKYNNENHNAPYITITSSNAGNYDPQPRTTDYEILKKDLTPKFETNLPDFAYKNDTLRVPSEVFQDTTALQQILDSIVAYEGFATDTVKKETDDAKVLTGKAEVKIDYDVDRGVARYAPVLAKRVETTQKATATIITDGVSADNYAPLTRAITIVEMADYEGGYAMFCKREEKCIALSEEICDFLDGKVVPTCGEVPILHSQLSTLNSQLPKYYTLKGTFLGTQKPTAPGIYIEVRAENFQPQQRIRKVIVK